LFQGNIGVHVVLAVVLAAPAFFVDRGLPLEVVRVKLGDLGEVVVLAVQDVVPDLDGLDVAVQPGEQHPQAEGDGVMADPQQASATDFGHA
jgi:hypothetical protein